MKKATDDSEQQSGVIELLLLICWHIPHIQAGQFRQEHPLQYCQGAAVSAEVLYARQKPQIAARTLDQGSQGHWTPENCLIASLGQTPQGL